MKPFAFIILTALMLSACQADNTSPTPTITSTLSPTETKSAPIVTETPTPIPETAEQKAERELTDAVAAGLRINNPDSWTGQYAVYANWYRNAHNPELVSDAQLDMLTTFMQNGRTKDQLRYFSENPDNAKIILTDFLVQFVPGSITREAAQAMSVADLENLAYSQNEYLRQFLELRYHALTGEETLFASKETMSNETDPKSCVFYHEEWKDGKLAGNGAYGMWVRTISAYLKYPDAVGPPGYKFHINMYGKNTERCGVLGGDVMVADFMGYGKKSDGVYFTHWLMKDENGKPYLHTYLVVTDPNYAMHIPAGSPVLGATPVQNGIDSLVINRDVALTTGYAYKNDNIREQITLDILKQFHRWPPVYTAITSGAIAISGGGYVDQLFDPETGLMIIGSPVGEAVRGYISFGDGVNPWP